MSNPVSAFWYDSVMTGAPSLSGEAGKLIGVLDACLKDGFGSVTLDSIVVAEGVATATKSTGHGFTDYVVVTIAGATPSGLNGNKRLTRTSSTVFTFDATNISDQTATGTITAKMAPVGWTKPYSGTNKAVYARSDVAATAMVLRVDDSPAQYPTLIMYESMSDVDTGSGPAPTSSSYYTAKSSAASSTARAWRLFADSRAFYLFINADGSLWPTVFFFGDIIPYKTSDAYHCLLLAGTSQAVTSYLYLVNGTTTAALLARSYTQTGVAVASSRYSHRKVEFLGYGGMAVPNPVDNSYHVWPVDCWEATTAARGLMPGLYCPVHDPNLSDNIVLSAGSSYLFNQQTTNTSYRAALDITGPWR